MLMKKQFSISLFFIFHIVFLLEIHCQTKAWSLEQCIEHAKQNNLKIKQEQYNIQLAHVNIKEQKSSMLPSINGNASQNYNFGRTIDRFTNDFTTDLVVSNYFYLSSNIRLFNGFQTLNSIRRSKIEYEASVVNLKILEDDISISIALNYLQILYNIEMLNVLNQQHQITLKEIERAESFNKIGITSNTELLNFESQSAIESHQILKMQSELEISKLNVSQILNLKDHENFEIVIPNTNIDINKSNLSLSFILEYALQYHPEIKKSKLQIESAKKSYSIAKAAYFPSLSLGANTNTGFSEASMQIANNNGNQTFEMIPFKEQINRNFYYSIGLNLSIPIFNSMQTKYTVEKNSIYINQANNLLEQNKSNLTKIITQNYYDAFLALEKFNSAQKQLNYLTSLFKSSEEKFILQKINYLEYQDSKSKLHIAESELLQAKYEYIFKKIILDFYVGNPIKL